MNTQEATNDFRELEFSILSPRETEVLELCGAGLRAQDIARRLGLKRVSTHRSNIVKYLGLEDTSELAEAGKALNQNTREAALEVQAEVVRNLGTVHRPLLEWGDVEAMAPELIKDETTLSLVNEPYTHDIAHEVVVQEVRVFLS